MKNYFFVVVLLCMGTLYGTIRFGNYVIWGTRYERAQAFVEKLKSQYPAQFELMNKIAEGKKIGPNEKSEVEKFSRILQKRMDRFELFEDIRPYVGWSLLLVAILCLIFAAQHYIRSRKALP